MATTQYIGARYVPLFYTNPDDNSNDWHAGVQYDPLTIVTDLNQSYTSKIPVPASVGRPSENPTYWILTGAYNAQISSLSSRVDAQDLIIDNLQQEVDAITLHDLKGVFIGDSFGPNIYTNLKSFTGTTDDDWVVSNEDGTGFVNPGTSSVFIDRLNNLVVDDPDAITHVIAIAGSNDTGSEYTSTVGAAVAAFVNQAKTLFPNATVYIGYCATLYRAIDWTGLRRQYISFIKYRYAEASVANGAVFIDGLTEALTDKKRRVGADYIHPTAEGYSVISLIIANYLRGGGSFRDQSLMYFNFATWTTEYYGRTYTMNTLFRGGTATPELTIRAGTLYNGAAADFTAGQFVTMCSYDDLPMIPYQGNMQKIVHVYVTASQDSGIYPMLIDLTSSGVRFSVYSISGVPEHQVTKVEILEDAVFTFPL